MSTRSMVIFTDKKENEIETTQTGKIRISKNRIKSCSKDPCIYVHWDGYPENRLREINNYMKLSQVRTDDKEYCSAWFIPYLLNEANKKIEEQIDCSGYGINGDISIDVCSYIYIVHCSSEVVTIIDGFSFRPIAKYDLGSDIDKFLQEWRGLD